MSNESDSLTYLWYPKKRCLILLKESATPDYWDRHWGQGNLKKVITGSRCSHFWPRLLRRYLPAGGRVLEGGCGTGCFVDALNFWGYGATGVDFAQATVEKVKSIVPELDIRYGDVRNLGFEDNSFDGYLSLGVLEHFWEGYDAIVTEMRRVLKIGGVAFVSFPCVSRLDRLAASVGGFDRYEDAEMPQRFYQFVLNYDSVIMDFEAAGFQYVRKDYRDGLIGLGKLHPSFVRLNRRLNRIGQNSRFVSLSLSGASFALAPLSCDVVSLVFKKR